MRARPASRCPGCRSGRCAGLSPPASANTITGIVWQWMSVTDQTTRQTTTVPNPASYTIIFNADGTASGKADCNTFTGTWSQQNGFHIQVTPNVMAACGTLDSQYLTLLNQVAAGGPDGAGNLALETAGGAQRMLFRNGGPAPAAPAATAGIQQHDHGYRLAVGERDGSSDQADDDRAEPGKLHHRLQCRWHHVLARPTATRSRAPGRSKMASTSRWSRT